MPFETRYSCTDCGVIFSLQTESRPSDKDKSPACPMCNTASHSTRKSISKSNKKYTKKELEKNQNDIITAQKAPSVGGSARAKAIDATAQIVMQDYGMTDINLGSSLRDGDTCAPKLQGTDASGVSLEQRVDQVFAPQPNKVMGMQGSNNLNRALMSQINAGAYRNQADPVRRQQNTGATIPTTILHEYKPEKTH